jgi:hypothetical protein
MYRHWPISAGFQRGIVGLVLLLMAFGALAIGLSGHAKAESAERVVFGAYINNLEDIDLTTNSYSVDLYLWLRWKNPKIDPSVTIEPMNTVHGDDAVELRRLYDAPMDMPDGSKYMAYRVQGSFNSKMDLAEYPFDVQTLAMEFEDSTYDGRALEYVPDNNPVTISDSLTLPGYIVGKPTATASTHRYPTNFGDISASGESDYSRITITLPVTRNVLPTVVKIIVPISIVVLITALVFLLPARMEDARIGIGITAMLTMVALQWTTTGSLPNVSYLMMIDLVYMLSIGYVLGAMAYTVLASRRARHDASESALDLRVGIASLVGYVALMVLTVVMFLWVGS